MTKKEGPTMIRWTMLAAVAALVITTAAGARTAAPSDPKQIVLQASDFPAGTRPGSSYGVPGADAKSYTAAFSIKPGDMRREEDVGIELWVAKDTATAKQIYQQQLATYTSKGPQIGDFKKAFKGESILKLPSYGDEQFADYLPIATRPHGQLIVRKNRVVWYLTVENCTPLSISCYGTSRTEAPIGKAKAIAELKKYGSKQKGRVGGG
jgi:hypothetical protein